MRRDDGDLPGWETDWTPALRRYADILGLHPVTLDDREVLGVQDQAPEGAGDWQPELAASMADWLLERPADQPE